MGDGEHRADHRVSAVSKDKRLNTRITDDLKRKLSDKASKLERSESWIVEQALKQYLAK